MIDSNYLFLRKHLFNGKFDVYMYNSRIDDLIEIRSNFIDILLRQLTVKNKDRVKNSATVGVIFRMVAVCDSVFQSDFENDAIPK